jgi:hypothetical protein
LQASWDELVSVQELEKSPGTKVSKSKVWMDGVDVERPYGSSEKTSFGHRFEV